MMKIHDLWTGMGSRREIRKEQYKNQGNPHTPMDTRRLTTHQ